MNAYIKKSTLLLTSIILLGCEKPQQKLIGTWIPDVSETKSYNKELLNKNPFGEFAINLIARTLKLKFSETELTIIMGDSEKTTNYKFKSFKDNIMVIQNDKNGSEMTFRFLSNDKLVFSNKSEDGDELDIIMVKGDYKQKTSSKEEATNKNALLDKQNLLNNAREIYKAMFNAGMDARTLGNNKTSFPFDSKQRKSSEYKKMLIDELYLTIESSKQLSFDEFLIGNISYDDSPNTIILMSKPDNTPYKVVFMKNGEGAVIKNEDQHGVNPPREPSFLD